MKKTKLAILGLAILIPLAVYAEKVYKPVDKSTMMPVGGADATGEAQILKVNSDGSINVNGISGGSSNTLGHVRNGYITISMVSGDSRTQFPSLETSSCTFQAHPSNSGKVYIGGATVTNANGLNFGVALDPSVALNDLQVTNLANVWAASDSMSNRVIYLCTAATAASSGGNSNVIPPASEDTLAACSNGVDDDSDTFTDCADPGCVASPNCLPPSPPATESTYAECTDHIDNDGDAMTDCADAGCSMWCGGGAGYCGDGSCNNGETSVSCPSDCSETGLTLCSDSIDNDNDTFTDCADSGCVASPNCLP